MPVYVSKAKEEKKNISLGRRISRVLAESLVGLGFLQSVSYKKSIPTHEKSFVVRKSGPNTTLTLILLGLGWPWVGELVGFIRYLYDFQPNIIW